MLGLEIHQLSILCHILEVVLILINMFSNLLESRIANNPDTDKWILFAMGLTMTVTQDLTNGRCGKQMRITVLY